MIFIFYLRRIEVNLVYAIYHNKCLLLPQYTTDLKFRLSFLSTHSKTKERYHCMVKER